MVKRAKQNKNNKKTKKINRRPKVDKKFRKKVEIFVIVLMVVTTVVLLFYFYNKKTIYKCSKIIDQSANGYKIKTYYDIYAYKNETKYIEIREIVYSDEKSILDFYKEDLTKIYEEQKKKYDGYSIKSETEREKMTLTVKIDFSKIKLEEYAKDNNATEYIKNKKLTPEGAKQIFNNIDAICE